MRTEILDRSRIDITSLKKQILAISKVGEGRAAIMEAAKQGLLRCEVIEILESLIQDCAFGPNIQRLEYLHEIILRSDWPFKTEVV